MRFLCVLCSVACVLCSSAAGQWSEPVTLASGLGPYGAGPELVPHAGDSVWVFWVGDALPVRLLGRCCAADTWRDQELVVQGEAGIFWPTGVVDDFGRVLVACYQGDYPTASLVDEDTWGIYTMTRTDSGWSSPALAQAMLGQVFPTHVRLGGASDGTVGMLWDESFAGIGSMESVMVSHRTETGWTPPRCLAPGHYPDTACSCGSLIPGDSTIFLVGFGRTAYPGGESRIEVWDLTDSLVNAPAMFSGANPRLAFGLMSRFLVFTHAGMLQGAENRGAGWSEPAYIASGIGWGGAALCADPFGWGWACWPDDVQQAVLVSYNRGAGWSQPETVATSSALGAPGIASDGFGNLHCVWFDHSGGGSGQLRYSRRLARPGAEDVMNGRRGTMERGPTIVRGVLFLAEAASREPQAASLLDASGREVMALHPGANDVSPLPSGVYFVRAVSRELPAASCQKVVIQR